MKDGATRTSYTRIHVTLTLENWAVRRYGWTTPIALMPALHKAPRWARDEMRKAGVPGRSKVRSITIDGETIDGPFDKKEK